MFMANKATNRIKIILVEPNKTHECLAEKFRKIGLTASRWCTCNMQPTIEILPNIAKLLYVDIRNLFLSTKSNAKL